MNSNDKPIDTTARQSESQTILKAFRFLENVGEQIEAVRKTLEAQVLLCAGLDKLGVKVKAFRELGKDDSSTWLCRTTTDTFEIFRARKKGRPTPLIYGAFQISLAPSRTQADQEFFPHVAILLADANEAYQWECEEFQLDEEFLADHEQQDDDPWERAGDRRWIAKSGDHWVAFVVPLVDLKNENDVKVQVIEPFIREVSSLLQKIDPSRIEV